MTKTIRRDPGKDYQLTVKNQGFEGNLERSGVYIGQDLFFLINHGIFTNTPSVTHFLFQEIKNKHVCKAREQMSHKVTWGKAAE